MSVAVLFVSLWRGWPPRKQLWRGRPSSQAFGQRQNAAGGNKNEAPYWRVRAGARPYRLTSPRSPIGIRASRRAAAFSAISATAHRSFELCASSSAKAFRGASLEGGFVFSFALND